MSLLQQALGYSDMKPTPANKIISVAARTLGGLAKAVILEDGTAFFISTNEEDIKSLIVDLNYKMSGEGDPSPDNPRPFLPFISCTVSVAHEEQAAEPEAEYPINWEDFGNVYYGVLDVTSGELTIKGAFKTYDASYSWTAGAEGSNTALFYTTRDTSVYYPGANYLSAIACDLFPTGTRNTVSAVDYEIVGYTGSTNRGQFTIRINKTRASDLTQFEAWIAENPVSVLYVPAEEQIIQLDPVTVEALAGENYVYADNGTIKELIY